MGRGQWPNGDREHGLLGTGAEHAQRKPERTGDDYEGEGLGEPFKKSARILCVKRDFQCLHQNPGLLRCYPVGF